jgi:hypothetical protein
MQQQVHSMIQNKTKIYKLAAPKPAKEIKLSRLDLDWFTKSCLEGCIDGKFIG